MYDKNRKDGYTTYCGGGLESSRHVLTAAHCVVNEELGEPLAVVLEDLEVTTDYDCIFTEEECGANGIAWSALAGDGAGPTVPWE